MGQSTQLLRNQRVLVLSIVMVFGLFQVGVGAAQAATITPEFLPNYQIFDLGSVPGVPGPYGGLTTKFDDGNTFLIGGAANTADGMLYSIGVNRDGSGHVTGFLGIADVFAEAAWNDGGVAYGPDNVLFLARWPVNQLGQTKPGSSTTDKVIDLAAFGVGGGGPGGGTFVPAGFAGAGTYKIVSWPDGIFYTLSLAPDGSGTFDVVSVTQGPTIVGGPEGFIYIQAGNPGFLVDSMLVSEFSGNTVAAYEIDANGDPIVSTRREFITGLDGAEGAFFDTTTGDFFFSTFGTAEDRVIRVQGFTPTPEPSTLLLMAVGLGGLLGYARRRRSE